MSSPDAAVVDPRLYRVDQGLAAVALLAAFAFQLPVLLPVWAILLGASGFVGPPGAPTLLLIAWLLPDSPDAEAHAEPLAPRRMAASSATVVLLLATGGLVVGLGWLASLLSLITAGFAAFDAATGLCGAYLLATKAGRRER